MNIGSEQVFYASEVEEIIFGLFEDVGRSDEERGAAVAPLVEILNQLRPEEDLVALRRYVEEGVVRMDLEIKSILKLLNHPQKAMSFRPNIEGAASEAIFRLMSKTDLWEIASAKRKPLRNNT